MPLATQQASSRLLLRMPSVVFGQASEDSAVSECVNASTRSGKWRLLAAQELAQPGLMKLQAVRHRGRIVDFVWVFASAAAARMLGRNALDLVGNRLLGVLAGHLGHLVVFDQYRCVVEHGAAEAIRQMHVVNGSNDIYRHGAVRLGDGVAVTLTNLSAVRRARALRLEVNALLAVNNQNGR